MKFFVSFIIFLLLLGLCTAEHTNLKISPAKSSLIINGPQKNCTIIYVSPDKNTSIDTRWSNNPGGNINNYLLTDTQVRVKTNWTRLEYGKYEFCFEATKEGMFYGAILFLPQNSLVNFGSWIDLTVINQNVLERAYLITGKAIASSEENVTNIGLGIIFFLLILLFLLIVIRVLGGSKAFKNKHA